jgi:hypothetical protein
MKNELIAKASRSLHKIGFKFKKHSPEILVVAGVVGIVASTVMACKAPTKVSEIVDESKQTIDAIHDALENEKQTAEGEVYTQEDANKDMAIVYTQTGLKFAKLYGPSVILGVASIACIIGSHRILRKRNVALAAAFATVDKSFKEYRGRLIDRFGNELDRELRFNIKAKEIEETVVDENGNETVVTKTVEVVDPNVAHSLYSVIYCEGCTGHTKSPELNKVFLIQQQNYANDKLRLNHIVTLNEVYDMLGVPRTAYGQIAGWVWTEDGTAGDNYIDFGIFDRNNPKACDFVNGYERSIVLDFNCIGNILEYM